MTVYCTCNNELKKSDMLGSFHSSIMSYCVLSVNGSSPSARVVHPFVVDKCHHWCNFQLLLVHP